MAKAKSPRAIRLGERIRDARRRKHLTQRVLAEKVGITVANLSMIENGRIENPGYWTVMSALSEVE